MNRQECNGWTNYETWLANLWFDDAFSDDADTALERAAEDTDGTEIKAEAVRALAETIEEAIVAATTEETSIPESGFVADILNAALREINYREIAEHYIDDRLP